MIYQSRNQSFI